MDCSDHAAMELTAQRILDIHMRIVSLRMRIARLSRGESKKKEPKSP
jgi:hypothetical protein